MKLLICLLLCFVGVALSTETCDGVSYDKENKICCFGVLLTTVENAKCCRPNYVAIPPSGPNTTPNTGPGVPTNVGPNVYNSVTQMCCTVQYGDKYFGKVYTRFENAKCCNLKQYDTLTKFCHEGTLIDVPTGNTDPAMCGDIIYDRSNQICCYDESTKVGVLHNKLTNWKCCKLTLYHVTDHICCAGVAHFRPANGKCCKETPYDSKHYICCNSQIQHIPPHYQPAGCCKGVVYSRRDHVCCNGHVSHTVPNVGCCNYSPYNTVTQLCCDGKVKDKEDTPECP